MIVVALVMLLHVTDSPASTGGAYGHVEFANSGAPAAQGPFLEGLALLHDFEYPGAAAAFRRAEAADSGFAMAYWGEAMTFNHPIWMEQERDTALAALAKLGPTAAARRARAKTEREQEYLDAVEILYGEGSKEDRDFHYRDAMAKLHAHYPDDVDAAAFYGLAILGTAHAGRDVATYMRAAGVLEEAWASHRDHPGLVHYLIHSYDDPDHAPLGLRPARIYAAIAPDAGHAQHMTSHIFLALGMWSETVRANVAAIADVDRMRAAAGKAPVRWGHYPSWLEYAYLQLGQFDEAKAGLISAHAAVASDTSARRAGAAMDPDRSGSGSLANMWLRYLIDAGDWKGEIAGWPVPKGAGPRARLDFAFGRAMGEIAGGTAKARPALDTLAAAGREVSELEAKQAKADSSERVRPAILLLEARGLLAERAGNLAEAEALLRQAIGLEMALPVAFGPPMIDKPTHELMGEFLLRHGRNDEARAEFQAALARTPGRRLATLGLEAASARSASAKPR